MTVTKGRPKSTTANASTSEVSFTGTVAKAVNVIDKDSYVAVMNYTTGRVEYNSKRTGFSLAFNEFGQTDEIQISELITIKNTHRRYLSEPWIIVLDEDVVKYLGLSDVYANLVPPEDIEGLFRMDAEKLKEILEKAPVGLIQTVVSMAVKKVENKELDSMSVIRTIEEVCKVQLIA